MGPKFCNLVIVWLLRCAWGLFCSIISTNCPVSSSAAASAHLRVGMRLPGATGVDNQSCAIEGYTSSPYKAAPFGSCLVQFHRNACFGAVTGALHRRP